MVELSFIVGKRTIDEVVQPAIFLEEIESLAIGGMEDMRPIEVDIDVVFPFAPDGSADLVHFFDDENIQSFFLAKRSKTGPKKTSPDNEIIVHMSLLSIRQRRTSFILLKMHKQ